MDCGLAPSKSAVADLDIQTPISGTHELGRAPGMTTMRLKTALWVAAYVRRCYVEGLAAVVRRRGAEEAGAVFVRVSRLDGTSDLFGPAPQSAFDAAQGAARAFTPSLATQSAPDAEVETYLARQMKFDPDIWIVEVEDRAGRNFLDLVAG
jgi:hypothetical protein